MTRRLRLVLAAAAVLVASVPAPRALAHGTSDAFVALAAADAGVALRWDVALRDLAALVPLDADADGAITAGEWRARRDAVASAALAAIDVSAQGGRCAPGPVSTGLARRVDGTYAVLRTTFACPGPAGTVEVAYRLMDGVDATHRAIVDAGTGAPLRLRPGDPPRSIAIDRPAGAGASVAAFALDGVRHILDGIDHLAFVVALALAAVVSATRERAALRPTVVRLVGVLTLFTVAHSITLAGVALGALALPARLVESVIAASVALAGVHVALAAVGRRRAAVPAWLVFVFGLVHGFGFGSALVEAGLGGRTAVPALVGFNLGVELGQLAVLAVTFPVLWALRERRGWRSAGVATVGAAIAVAGVGWFVQRALDVDLAAPVAAMAAPR